MTQSVPFSDVGSLRHGDLIARLSDVIVDDPNVTSSDSQISLYQLIGLATGLNGTSELTFKNLHLEKVRSTWQIVLLCVAYLLIFVASLSGNSLVCLVIYRTRRLHTVTNVFIANLAVSDLFITVINVPFNVVRHLITVTNVFIANLAVSDLFITVINVPFNVVRHLITVTNVFSANLAVSDLFITVINVPFNVVRHLITVTNVFSANLAVSDLFITVINVPFNVVRHLITVTNVFIANLAVSDLFITVINVPFNVVRHLITDWTFGHFTCGLVNFTLTVFVYVSTLTMTAIAVDRYIVILHPLRPRMSVGIGLATVAVTWLVGSLMSLPFAIFAQVLDVELFLYTSARCSVVYPAPSDVIERYVTLATFVTQYVIPVVITSVAYSCIAIRLCGRTSGAGTDPDDNGGLVAVSGLLPTRHQRMCHERVRRRSIALLAAVVVAFTVSWLPLNLYHIITDFHPDSSRFRYNSTTYLTTHWVAVSSVCCNPLAYCWLNASFRTSLRSICTRHRRAWTRDGRPSRRRKSFGRGRDVLAANVSCRMPVIGRREDFNCRSPGGALTYDRFGYRREAGTARRACQLPASSPGPTPPAPAVPQTPPPTTGTVAPTNSMNNHQPRHDVVCYSSNVWNEASVVGNGTDAGHYGDGTAADQYKIDAVDSSEISSRRWVNHHGDIDPVE